MADSSHEAGVTSPFAANSCSAEGELAIDESVLVRNFSLEMVIREAEECFREYLEHVSGEKGVQSHQDSEGDRDDEGDEYDSFVDITGVITMEATAESDGLTFADALMHANLSVETLAEGVIDTTQMPMC